MINHLVNGLTALDSPAAICFLILGVFIGMVFGVIPGLSTAVLLSIMLVFVYHIDLTATLCLFLGTQAASYYAASITSILLNTPAHPEAFAITLDGHPMARKGQAARALGLSAAATCVGGLIGCILLVAFVPAMNEFPNIFHPPEYVALVTLAMLLIGTLGAESVGKAVAAAGIGLILASVGPSLVTGEYRFTFNIVSLNTGLSLVSLALGVFAIPQMVMIFGTASTFARQDMTGREVEASEFVPLSGGFGRELMSGVWESLRHWGTQLSGGVIGTLCGVIPGIGGFTANFLSYGVAKQFSRDRQLFGTGVPQGIIAPEGSSLSKEAGSMIPTLGLGIPGGVGGALFLAALSIQGVRTGFDFQVTYPTVMYQIVWVIALSGILGTVAGVVLGPQLAKITLVPGPLFVPFVVALSIIGPFLTDANFFSVVELVIFGFVGLALRRLSYPLASFMLGLVLGGTFETNIYLTRSIYPGFSFITHRPLADAIFAVAIAVLIVKALEIRRERRQAAAEGSRPQSGYPVLAVVTSVSLVALSVFVVVYCLTHYRAATSAMPVIGAAFVLIPSLALLPRQVMTLVRRGTGSGPAGATVPPASQPAADDGPAPVVDKSWGVNGQYRREAFALGFVILLVVMCWLIGFAIAVALFMLGYGLTCTQRFLRTLRSRLIFSVTSAVFMWLMVTELFELTHLLYVPKLVI